MLAVSEGINRGFF